LQKNFNISIINYKYFSKKYIIYESKRIGKEYEYYNDDIYIFEGEYLNGQDMEKEKNIILIKKVIYYLKVNIYMEKEMENEKNIPN